MAEYKNRLWKGLIRSRLTREKLALYAQLIRLNKPVGWLLLLWPTLWALWIANKGVPTLHLLAVFVLGVFLTRSAGVVVNDLVDRDFDLYVERTRTVPSPPAGFRTRRLTVLSRSWRSALSCWCLPPTF